MQETILIAKGGTELLRTLARHGCNTLCTRIVTAAELAELSLMRAGAARPARCLSAVDAASMIYAFLGEIPYFASASYRDAQNLAAVIAQLQMLCTGDPQTEIAQKLGQSEFTEKNDALLTVYRRYLAALEAGQMTDTAGLLRLAAANGAPLSAECLLLEPYPLMPLERMLIETLTGSAVRSVTLQQLCGRADAEQIPMPQITEAYGAYNEAEAVIAQILTQKLPFDSCTVAVSDPARYVPLLCEITERLGIPATFGCGVPVTFSNAAAVLRDFHFWETQGYHGKDALTALLMSTAFDRKQLRTDCGIEQTRELFDCIDLAGSLRISCNPAENQQRLAAYREALELEHTDAQNADADAKQYAKKVKTAEQTAKLADILAQGATALVRDYTRRRKGAYQPIDNAGAAMICETLDRFTEVTGKSPMELVPQLLTQRILCECSCEGKLHITDIGNAQASLRGNLFVMGLSAGSFPGAPAENYLLLDSEMRAFGEADIPDSDSIITRRRDAFDALLNTAAALDIPASLSFSDFDSAELKGSNASSVLFGVYSRAAGGSTDMDAMQKALRKVGYFAHDLTGMSKIGQSVLQNRQVAAAPKTASGNTPDMTVTASVYPTAIEKYLECPRKFLYAVMLGIPEQSEDDVFAVISAADFGKLVHQAMEMLRGEMPEPDDFLEYAESLFDAYLKKHPPMDLIAADRERHQYLDTVTEGYERAAESTVILAEERLTMQYSDTLTVTGIMDALVRESDGTELVVDYKTGRKPKQESPEGCKPDALEKALDSCIQILLYAYMLRRQAEPHTAAGGEYRYLRNGKTVSCQYSDAAEAHVSKRLDALVQTVSDGVYPAAPGKDQCKYCRYHAICAEGVAES